MTRRAIHLVLFAAAVLLLPTASPASPNAMLAERIESYVRERAPMPPSSIVLPPLDQFSLPGRDAEDVEIHLTTHPATRFVGRVPVTVSLTRQGRLLRRGIVPIEVRVTVPVVVARRPVSRGQLIGPEHLSLEFREVQSVPEDWIEDPTEIEGFRAKRRVAQGTPWKRGWAEAAPAVRRGQAVRTVFAQGGLTISGRGQVRQDGHVGEWVRVLNIDSKREIWGRVAGDGTILVGF